MQYAMKEGSRVLPTKGDTASCPQCGGNVLAKCGSIMTHHWAHLAADCDPWSEPMTDWHIGWQSLVPPENREVTISPHRADIRLNDGLVVEIQHSPISVEEIREREKFYKNMIWIFDARDFAERFVNYHKPYAPFMPLMQQGIDLLATEQNKFSHGGYRIKTDKGSVLFSEYRPVKIHRLVAHRASRILFKWRRMRPSITQCHKPVFFDVGATNLLFIDFSKQGKGVADGFFGCIIPRQWTTEMFHDANNGINHIWQRSELKKIPIGSTIYGELGIGCEFVGINEDGAVSILTQDGRTGKIPGYKVRKWKAPNS